MFIDNAKPVYRRAYNQREVGHTIHSHIPPQICVAIYKRMELRPIEKIRWRALFVVESGEVESSSSCVV